MNLYLLDFGSGSLKAFEKAPQVGDVITATEEEKLTNFLKMLRKEVDYRKACFSEYGGDHAEYIRSAQKTVPNILVVLQNYSAFSEVYEDLQDEFTILSRDGLKYGIYFLVTAETTNAVRYRTQQNFKMILSLQLNDPSEYPILLGKTDGLVPAKCKGRGLAVLDKVYEFQTAYLSDESELMDLLRNKCREWTERDSGKARRVPILPGIVDYDFVSSAIQGIKAVPIGVEKKELEIASVNLGDKVLYPVLGLDILSLAPFTEEFIRVCRDIVPVEVVDAERTLKEGLSTVPMEQYEEYVRELFQEMVERHNHYIDSRLDPKSLNEYREKVVVISGLRRFVERLSEDGKDKLFTLIDKAESFYKIHFAVFESEKQFELVSDRRIRGKANGEEGLWIGNGINYQSVLDTSRMLGLEDEIGADFGYQVERGRLVLVKVLSGKEM